MNKKEIKEYCINMFESGNTFSKIAADIGMSRTYVANLIKNDEKYTTVKYSRKIKVYKRKKYKQMSIHIPTEFIKGLGISEDRNKEDYVNVFYDKKNKQIIISRA